MSSPYSLWWLNRIKSPSMSVRVGDFKIPPAQSRKHKERDEKKCNPRRRAKQSPVYFFRIEELNPHENGQITLKSTPQRERKRERTNDCQGACSATPWQYD